MSLIIGRKPGESFVLIDENYPESFALVRVNYVDGGNVSISVDAPANVHILRREILHRYAVHQEVLEVVERMEGTRET